MAENILYNEGRRSETDLNKDKDWDNKGKMDDNTGKMAEAEAGTNNENKPAETDTSENSLELTEADSEKEEPNPHNDSMDSIGMAHLKITGDSESMKENTGTEHETEDTADENNERKLRERKTNPGKYAKMLKGEKPSPEASEHNQRPARKKSTTDKQRQTPKDNNTISHLKSQNQTLKDDIKKLRKELEKSQKEAEAVKKRYQDQSETLRQKEQENRRLTEENHNATTENKALNVINNRLQEEITEQSETSENNATELRNQISNTESQLQDNEEQLMNTERQLQNTERQLLDTETQLENERKKTRQLENDKRALENDKRTLQEVAEDKATRINVLEHQLRAERQKYAEQQTNRNRQPEEPRKNVHIIGDSNSHRIHPHLERKLQTRITHTWMPTLEETTTWSRNLQPEQNTNTTIIIMAGTNDIKNGKTAKECNKQVREIENNLKGLNIEHLVVQLPPVYPPQGLSQRRDRETTKLNKMLEAIISEADLVHTQAIEGDRDAIETDGLHLTRKAAEKMAEKIVEKIQSHHQTTLHRNPQTPTPQHTSQSRQERGEMERDNTEIGMVKAPQNIAGLIIGHQGERLKRMKMIIGVEIDREDANQQKIFIITGNKENVAEAKQAIKKNQRRRGKKRQTTGNPTSAQVQHKLQILPSRNVQVWKQMQLHTRRRTNGHLTKNTRNTSRNNMETPGQTQNTIQQRGKKQIQFQQFRIQRSTQLEIKKQRQNTTQETNPETTDKISQQLKQQRQQTYHQHKPGK